MSGSKPRPLIDRFIKKVDFDGPDGCWLWTATVNRHPNQGYGTIWSGNRMVAAHRVAWELSVGPIPEGTTIDHLCRVRSCVNPDHLEPVTNRENILRGTNPAAANAQKTHCIDGHPLDGPNGHTTAQGKRQCRICDRRRYRNWYQRRKAE